MNLSKKGTGIENPYDIIIKCNNKITEYIEVKTTHTTERIFNITEREFKFAKQSPEKYKLYLITNFGSGNDTNLEIIENVYKTIKNKIISRKISL